MHNLRKYWAQFDGLCTQSTEQTGFVKKNQFCKHSLCTQKSLLSQVPAHVHGKLLAKFQGLFYTSSTSLTNTTKLNKGLL